MATYIPVKAEKLTHIEVSGFKSLRKPCAIRIGQLTIIGGANSSGKTSILQPLLLFKQTLDADYDAGDLLLDGANVSVTDMKHVLSRFPKNHSSEFTVRMGFDNEQEVIASYKASKGKIQGPGLSEFLISMDGVSLQVVPKLQDSELYNALKTHPLVRRELEGFLDSGKGQLSIVSTGKLWPSIVQRSRNHFRTVVSEHTATRMLRQMIHIPGLRGNPERVYKRTGIGPVFPGQFQEYVAAILANLYQSKSKASKETLQNIGNHLSALGLTWKVQAKQVSHSDIEVLVGRTPTAHRGGASDLVSLADVGLGISQVLPVLVALEIARNDQLVYVEQPEIHLHPKAQVELGRILYRAARAGRRIIIETHSNLLLTGLQAEIASHVDEPIDAPIHWFSRNEDGETRVSSGDLDREGSFGDVPVDLGREELKARSDYLKAVGF